MDLMYLLYSLLRKKWIIIFSVLLGLLAGYIFTMFRPREYVSFAQYSTGFTMEQKVKIRQDEQFNIYEIDLRFNNMVETFRSPKVMGMLSYKLLLHDLEEPKPFRQLTNEQKKTTLYKTANFAKVKDILRSKLREIDILNSADAEESKVFELTKLYNYNAESMYKKLAFERAGRTDFFNIFCRSDNPEFSAFVVNTIGEQFVRFFNSIYGGRSKVATGKLDSLAAAKKKEVDSLTKKLEDFRNKVGPSSGQDMATNVMGVVQELSTQYLAESGKLSELNGDLLAVDEQLASLRSTNSPTTNNNKQIMDLKDKNSQLELSLNGKSDAERKTIQDEIDANTKKILQLSAGSNPRTAKSRERIDDLIQRRIELLQKIEAAKINVNRYKKQKDTYEGMVNKGGGADVIVKDMEDNLELVKKEYQALRQSLQSSLDQEVNPENNFKLTLVGQPAYNPEPRGRMIIMGLAGTMMLLLSGFIILLLEFLDSSYKTPTIFQRLAKVKLLSIINRINLRKKPLSEYFHQNGQSENKEAETNFVENMRKLRFELEQSGKKTFLVTSTRPKEGKSVIIESLANSLSLAKKKVLIIDANFSHNTLTRKFGAQQALGEFSLNGRESADKVKVITTPTSIPNIEIVGCKEGNYSPSEILPKNNLLENLPKLTDNYDFIFIEGAALNNHSDSKELSKYVEGIIAVFSARSGQGQTDKDSIQYLKSTGEKFVGSVLNLVEKENMDL